MVSAHVALIGAIEDMARAQRESGAWLSRELECGRGGLAVVRLLGGGPRQVGELAHALRVDVSVASRHVAGLVEAGIVERDVPAADRRTRTVALTDAGRELAARSSQAALDLAASVFGDWSEDDVAAAAAQIRRVATAIGSHHHAAAGTAGSGPPPDRPPAHPPGPQPAPHVTSAPSPEREIA
ncbi:MarR family winged helix-turn-helix transcriptional regulator [uncultured Cellulomonas sp.]|uniref:MarR family winged helix-turn-helix transcriptional regulator n=1 Tax=uncultured Cellulomonas sp. TaxID=189682 RepID=UPI00261671C8|nr:MarR family winged helix-turn-helix transcriptional regulator [uncultured Cellulomonas sp.]